MSNIRYDLVPNRGLLEVHKALSAKLEKYNKNEWMSGLPWSDVLSNLKKHLTEFELGNDFSEDGILNMAEVAMNALILLEYTKIYPQGDDRILHINKPIISLDVDDVCADFLGACQTRFGIKLNPYWKGSYKMPEYLNELSQDKDFWINLPILSKPPFEPDLYISSRSIPVEWTMEFLEKNGFPCAPVVHVPWNESKVTTLKQYNVSIHVDDKYKNYQEATDAGIFCYLMSAPHNIHYDVGTRRINSLNDLKGIK